MAFARPAQGLFGGAVSTGEMISIRLEMDLSQADEFFARFEGYAEKLGKAPSVIAGGKYGTPLVTLLRQTTPFNRGRRPYGGGHLANMWRKEEYEGAQGTEVQIYNASSRADILNILELGARRHTIRARATDRLFFKDGAQLLSKYSVVHPGFAGRFFIRAVVTEANRRLRKYIDDMIGEMKGSD